jgi:large subunit ribosomal protein L4e
MKIHILNETGNKTGEMNSNIFETPMRIDIAQKLSEIERFEERQPYSPFYLSGLQTSASGNVKHNRHTWKTDRGKGFSRFPKKRMSDKGDRFVWVGAVAPGTKGGRRAHPPMILRAPSKINKKEKLFAIKSAIAMTGSLEMLKKKYSSLQNENIKINLPLVFEDKIISLKSKDFFDKMEKILGENLISLAIQRKEVRAGRGKMRNRKYKSNAGMILVVSSKQDFKVSGIEVVKAKNLRVRDLFENGARLTAFTESALKELEERLSGKSRQVENKTKEKKE